MSSSPSSPVAKNTHGVGRYSRCLLEALRDLEDCEIVESHEPRRCEVYHSPWLDGALLRCPVPQVVTLHDLAPIKRSQMTELDEFVGFAADAVRSIIAEGVEKSMTRFNRRAPGLNTEDA